MGLALLCGTDEQAASRPALSAPLSLADPSYSQAKRRMNAEAKVCHLQLPLLLFHLACTVLTGTCPGSPPWCRRLWKIDGH